MNPKERAQECHSNISILSNPGTIARTIESAIVAAEKEAKILALEIVYGAIATGLETKRIGWEGQAFLDCREQALEIITNLIKGDSE